MAARKKIAQTAVDNISNNPHKWDYSENNGPQYPANSWKCSGFVCDILRDAGYPVAVEGLNRCPTAGEWAGSWNPKNWRTLEPDEVPEFGDVAAKKLPPDPNQTYTGHTGIVVNGGVAQAHEIGSDISDFSSVDPDRPVRYKRYTGD